MGGTILSIFQIGKTGPNLKDSSGALEVRNDTDTSYATVRAASDLTNTNNAVTVASHEIIDSLVHNLAETCHVVVTRDGSNRVTDVVVWTDNTLTTKVRETNITRTSGRVSQTVVKQYNGVGSLVQTVTSVYTRVGGRISTVAVTETL